MSTGVDWENLPREEAIQKAMEIFHMQREDAALCIDITQGVVDGDMRIVDKNGKPTGESAYDGETISSFLAKHKKIKVVKKKTESSKKSVI